MDKICAKGQKDSTPWQLQRIGGSRYMCGRERGHSGACGEWRYVSQPDHAEALATGRDPMNESFTEAFSNIKIKEQTMAVRAKFTVQSITTSKAWNSKGLMGTVHLQPVTSGSDENKAFYEATPGGKIELGTVNEEALKQFNVGDEFYVDFTKA